MLRCSKCVLPDTYPGILYDEGGVCNYCKNHREKEPLGKEQLIDVLQRLRPKGGKYDCILALSGGRDSTYALYYAVNELRLKVLALTIDNGLLPEHTIRNINKAVEITGVDHVWIKHDLTRKMIKPLLNIWMKRPSPALISLFCLGCRQGMFREFYKFGKKTGISLFFGGGGEPEQSFATAFFSKHPNRMVRKLSLITGMAKEILLNPAFLIHPSVTFRMLTEYFFAYFPINIPMKIYCPDWYLVDLFSYLPYDEEGFVDTIRKKMQWENYNYSKSSWRSDCKVAVLKNVFYYKLLKFSKNDELVSNMIRKGMLTREKALERVKEENDYPDEFLREFCREMDLSYEKLKAIGS